MLNFKEYLVETGGSFLPTAWTGSDATQDPWKMHSGPHDVTFPKIQGIDFMLPSVTINSKIQKIEKNRNPIQIILANGTKLFLTIDQFKRIHGNPAEGRIATVVFQRHPEDKSENPSKINSITIT